MVLLIGAQAAVVGTVVLNVDRWSTRIVDKGSVRSAKVLGVHVTKLARPGRRTARVVGLRKAYTCTGPLVDTLIVTTGTNALAIASERCCCILYAAFAFTTIVAAVCISAVRAFNNDRDSTALFVSLDHHLSSAAKSSARKRRISATAFEVWIEIQIRHTTTPTNLTRELTTASRVLVAGAVTLSFSIGELTLAIVPAAACTIFACSAPDIFSALVVVIPNVHWRASTIGDAMAKTGIAASSFIIGASVHTAKAWVHAAGTSVSAAAGTSNFGAMALGASAGVVGAGALFVAARASVVGASDLGTVVSIIGGGTLIAAAGTLVFMPS